MASMWVSTGWSSTSVMPGHPRPWSDFAKILDHLDHLVGVITLAACGHEQLLDLSQDSTLWSRSDHGDAPSAAKLEKAFIPKNVQRPQHRVLVDAEDCRHVFGQWQALTRTCFSVCDRPPDLGGNLVMQGKRF
jgi:hypothetical protein